MLETSVRDEGLEHETIENKARSHPKSNQSLVLAVSRYPIADLKELDGLELGCKKPIAMMDGYNFNGAKMCFGFEEPFGFGVVTTLTFTYIIVFMVAINIYISKNIYHIYMYYIYIY